MEARKAFIGLLAMPLKHTVGSRCFAEHAISYGFVNQILLYNFVLELFRRGTI